jgi:hypothetical protein
MGYLKTMRLGGGHWAWIIQSQWDYWTFRGHVNVSMTSGSIWRELASSCVCGF